MWRKSRWTRTPGPVLDWNDEVFATLIASGIDAGRPRPTTVDLSVTDFFGREVAGKKVPIARDGPAVVKFGSGPELRGFLKITARSTAGDSRRLRTTKNRPRRFSRWGPRLVSA